MPRDMLHWLRELIRAPSNETGCVLSLCTEAQPAAPFGHRTMSYENIDPELPDPNRIRIEDAGELQYWSRSLHATPDELRLAVATVGPFVEKVCEFIRRT